ncbi:conjugal transfer protein TraQ [Paraburkholderia sp. BR10872]|uniref:conjugal transfer protein TraQ n=1 Tax=Paraburkholderia sp. BR10872 TaxID=3236989 RepID=UPI0034D24193
MITSIAKDLLTLQALAQTFALGVGIVFCAAAIQNAMKKSASAGADVSGQSILVTFLIGAALANFSWLMTNTIGSLGSSGTTYGSLISYSGASAAGSFAGAVNAALTIVSTFGWWYGLKGWTLLKRASSGGGGGGYEDHAWKGFVHILGGAALVNITGTLDAFQATIGSSS